MSIESCIKGLWLLLIILLTIYAPLELTRVIIANELVLNLHPLIPSWQFIAELGVFWTLYVAGMVIIGRFLWLKSRG